MSSWRFRSSSSMSSSVRRGMRIVHGKKSLTSINGNGTMNIENGQRGTIELLNESKIIVPDKIESEGVKNITQETSYISVSVLLVILATSSCVWGLIYLIIKYCFYAVSFVQ